MHVVATAGHVDHGKSTLLRALTGMDPDGGPRRNAGVSPSIPAPPGGRAVLRDVVIPLLEYLDRRGRTRRIDGVHRMISR
ncbi:SelB C-terminal domain-containing protein [Streptosporangium sp. NPDC051023]|uniref:SelB domain-containing protein n=1 Tax=Streptosporangium sp. NPDC051023 TaxID=3155410 RepID=UPI00344F9907